MTNKLIKDELSRKYLIHIEEAINIISQEERVILLERVIEKLFLKEKAYTEVGIYSPRIYISANHLKEAIPILKELRKSGFKCKSYKDDYNNSRVYLLENSDGKGIRVYAVFKHNAQCRIERVVTGTKVIPAVPERTEEIYEYKAICKDDSDDVEKEAMNGVIYDKNSDY